MEHAIYRYKCQLLFSFWQYIVIFLYNLKLFVASAYSSLFADIYFFLTYKFLFFSFFSLSKFSSFSVFSANFYLLRLLLLLFSIVVAVVFSLVVVAVVVLLMLFYQYYCNQRFWLPYISIRCCLGIYKMHTSNNVVDNRHGASNIMITISYNNRIDKLVKW